jgi:hypothetical protein
MSFTARSWRDPRTGELMLRLQDVAEGTEVRLADGLLLLRVTAHERGALYRCYVRHIASGHEIALQGGRGLRAFVAECLLEGDGAKPGKP